MSFFGPFYGGYNVVALDPNYQWAMVVGSDLDYLWILSRTPTLPPGVRNRLLATFVLSIGIYLYAPMFVSLTVTPACTTGSTPTARCTTSPARTTASTPSSTSS